MRRVTSGEISAAELSRELGIHPSLLQHWKRRITGGARVAVTANEDVVPVSELKAAQQRIKELASASASARSAGRRWRSRSAGCPA